jgi:8-oxo-dGTP pyrophosphatase MutT (NUDIX family)
VRPEDARYVVAVAAIIFKEGKVLAMRRAAHKDAGAGLWETLSGRVHPGEEPVDAVRREIVEECGLTVALEARPLTAYCAKRGAEDMILILYRADYLAGEVIMSHEHDRYAWLSPGAFAKVSTLDKLVSVVRAEAGDGD